MKIEPIRRYAQPQLPTREIVDEHPELLRLLPKRWQANSAVVAALAACVALSGCAKSGSKGPSQVAPVFMHGDGRGSLGCVAVNPPVFLSEGEARAVILDEAKRAGIVLADHAVLPDVGTPATTTQYQSETHYRMRTRAVTLDGFNRKRLIGFEFVSRHDFDNWKGWEWGRSTVSRYDILTAAQVLRNGVSAAEPAGAYAVFYDPCLGPWDAKGIGGPRPDYTQRRTLNRKAGQMSREQLRAQVKDFIKWLKAQGVI